MWKEMWMAVRQRGLKNKSRQVLRVDWWKTIKQLLTYSGCGDGEEQSRTICHQLSGGEWECWDLLCWSPSGVTTERNDSLKEIPVSWQSGAARKRLSLGMSCSSLTLHILLWVSQTFTKLLWLTHSARLALQDANSFVKLCWICAPDLFRDGCARQNFGWKIICS